MTLKSNKIEGTPILKLAMVKRLQVEEFIEEFVEEFVEKFIEKFIEKFAEKFVKKSVDHNIHTVGICRHSNIE